MSADDAPLYIVGAGGVGREAHDIAVAGGRDVIAFLDDFRAGDKVRERAVLPPAEALAGGAYVVAIAEARIRERLASMLDGLGLFATTLVHPRAVISLATAPEAGLIVHANVLVSGEVTVGRHCQVHYNATIGHDCVLGDRVTVLPGANVAGTVTLGADVLVGSGAVVLQGLTVGSGAVVGAGAVVTRDVAPGAVVVGSPARPR